MAEITATMVKDLREKTGAGMMDCKKALNETKGDFAAAEEWLRKKGISKAASKGGRVAAEGLVGVYSGNEGKVAALVEVNCETDFVARNDDFLKLVGQLGEHIAKAAPMFVKAEDVPQGTAADEKVLLYEQTLGGKKVKDLVIEATAKIGEKIDVRRFARFAVEGAGFVGTYVHGGKIGVIVELTASSDAVAKHPETQLAAKELALQVASMKPIYTRREEVPPEAVEKAKADIRFEMENMKQITIKDGKPVKGILRSQDAEKLMVEVGGRLEKVPASQIVEIKAITTPPDKVEGAVTGKLGKFYEGVCLVDQAWAKDDKKKMKDVVAEAAKKAGGELTVKRFARLEVGEGIEKKKDDLAAEVAKTLGH
jgi:elongation factor Ts